jgi:hypothetical protein
MKSKTLKRSLKYRKLRSNVKKHIKSKKIPKKTVGTRKTKTYRRKSPKSLRKARTYRLKSPKSFRKARTYRRKSPKYLRKVSRTKRQTKSQETRLNTPKTNTKSSLIESCYKFNDVKICRRESLRYYETQEQLLCGLHAINNFTQNQTRLLPHPRLLSKLEMEEDCDELCKTNFHVEKFSKHCNLCQTHGWYNVSLLSYTLKKRLNFETKYLSDLKIFSKGLQHSFNEDKEIVGFIILYKAPRCVNHFVTAIPLENENKFIVIDSDRQDHLSLKHGEVIDSTTEVLKYFKHFLAAIEVRAKQEHKYTFLNQD